MAAGPQAQAAAMGCGDGPTGRQAHAGAAAAACGVRPFAVQFLHPLEGLEDARPRARAAGGTPGPRSRTAISSSPASWRTSSSMGPSGA